MTIDTVPDNVTDIASAMPTPDPLPLIDAAKAAKLRAIITARTEAERETERLRHRISFLESEPIDARDPRMRHIWVAAARAARESDYCTEYDNIVYAVGGVTLEDLSIAGELDRTYRVRTHVTVEVHLTIDAADAHAAISKVDDLDNSDIRDVVRNQLGSAIGRSRARVLGRTRSRSGRLSPTAAAPGHDARGLPNSVRTSPSTGPASSSVATRSPANPAP
jgi:hypothetical protein